MEGGKLTRELVTPLLDTDDPALQKMALEIISKHDGWAKEMIVLLRQWLTEPLPADQDRADTARLSILRGVLLAQSSDAEIQKLVADSLNRTELPVSMRLLLLEVIQRSRVETFPSSWQTTLKHNLQHNNRDVRLQAVRIVQDRKFDAYDSQLKQSVLSKTEPADLRVEQLIALAPRLDSVQENLFDFVMGRFSENVAPLDRLAAARALAESPLTDKQLLQLAAQLDSAGPMAIPVLLRAFSQSSSENVGRTLVAALDRSPAATNLSPDEVAGLLRSYPETVQKSAQNLLKRLGVDPEKQQKRLAELYPLMTGGDAAKGRDIFFGKKAACAGCHAVARQGGRVGPDLTTIGKIRTGRDLTEAIAFPSASFAREFRTYVIVTGEGKVHTGVISRQTADSVFLRRADLAEVRISRKNIEEMQESPTSIMPKGLDKTLTKEELQNLLAFLQGLK
jgi:putative heme-binding domain-containing protein